MIDRTIDRVWDKKRPVIKFTHRGQHACACVEDSLFSSEKLPHWYMERRRCLQTWKEKKSFSSYRINFMQPKLYGKLLNHSSERGVVKFKNGNCTDCWLIRSLDVHRGIKACDGRILLPKTRLHGHYWSIGIIYQWTSGISHTKICTKYPSRLGKLSHSLSHWTFLLGFVNLLTNFCEVWWKLQLVNWLQSVQLS